jgi:hypothetical protein
MFQTTSALTIGVSADRLWRILNDLDLYELWNPFIRGASGRLEEGARIRIVMASPLLGRRRLRPLITKVRPPYGFRWRDRLFLPRFFDGEYSFLQQINGPRGTRFVQTAVFKGVLAAVAGPWLRPWLEQKQDAMNRALKARAETCRQRDDGIDKHAPGDLDLLVGEPVGPARRPHGAVCGWTAAGPAPRLPL